MIGWRMWISFEPPVPRHFVSYNIREVVQPIRCERCKAEGKPVKILIPIIIVSLVLTLAVLQQCTAATRKECKGCMDPDAHCPFKLPDCPGRTRYLLELASVVFFGGCGLVYGPLSEQECKPAAVEPPLCLETSLEDKI